MGFVEFSPRSEPESERGRGGASLGVSETKPEIGETVTGSLRVTGTCRERRSRGVGRGFAIFWMVAMVSDDKVWNNVVLF